MKEFYRFFSVGVLCLFLSLFLPLPALAQVQTARYISTSSNSNGFYEYLPAGYESGSQPYPLLVFLHGIGELGNGGSNLRTILGYGLPKLINQGSFPQSFTVNNSTFSFIVISPQFINWPTAAHVDAAINYAIQHYRVDINRIYVTGLSMGGGVTWDYAAYGGNGSYARKVAAILPVCGAGTLGDVGALAIASANLPVYATHNQDDPTVPSYYTVNNINLINKSAPNPRAIDTIFPASGHDAWSRTYDPAFVNPRTGLNVYQWMLQYQRTNGVLPVTLTDYTASLSGDQLQVTIKWATANEENNNYFILQRSADGTQFTGLDTVAASNQISGHQYSYIDRAPLAGNNFYRLSQVDKDGKATVYGIRKVTVSTQGSPVFRLSPNPAGNTLYLELTQPGQGALDVSLSDMQGRTLQTWRFQKQGLRWDQSIDLSHLPPGNYFIRVQGAKIGAVQQFIKK